MRRLLLLTVLLLVGACRSTLDVRELGPVSVENAGVHIERAREERADGEHAVALRRLIALRSLVGLAPDHRLAVEELLRATSLETLDALVANGASSGQLLDLYEEDLAPRLKARAGVAAARRRLEEGRTVDAFKLIKRIERELPAHVERAAAGAVLADAGLDMIARKGRYSLFFRYASRGREALEFLVVHYPFEPRCAEAYAALVDHYLRRKDYDLAIERAEDLLIYHPEHPLVVQMQSRLPELRFLRLKRDDFDRTELLQARSELELWLARFGGREGLAELEERTRDVLRECHLRLANSDLTVARFYDAVDEATGVRLHAERALESAVAAGAEDAIEEAEELLARHAEASVLPAGGLP